MKSILLYLFITFISAFSFASNWSALNKDELSFKFGITGPQLQFNFEDKTSTSTKVSYRPNISSRTFVSFGYRNLGFSLSTPNKMNPEDVVNKGVSDSIDYQIRFYGTKITYEAFYQNYQGYYIENTSEIDNTIAAPQKILRPDIVSKLYGLNMIYNFDPDSYSLGVSVDQNGRTKASGGSFLMSLSLGQQELSSSTSMVPSQLASVYTDIDGIVKMGSSSLLASFGYGYIATYAGFYINGTLLIGGGIANQTFEYLNSPSLNQNYGNSRGIIKINFGYNGQKHAAGVNVLADNYTIPVSQNRISFTTTEVNLHYVYRFSGVNIPLLNPISGIFD